MDPQPENIRQPYYSRHREILLIVLLYTMAHGLILFNTGVYWDDWTLIGHDPKDLIAHFSQTGHPLVARLHALLLSLPHQVTIYRALTFISFLGASLFLLGVLDTIEEIDRPSRFFIVLFFALLPVNSARITLICLPYSVCNLLFFLGLWLVSKYEDKKRPVHRVLALVAFLSSFTTGSLLVIYLVVPIYIAYRNRGEFGNISAAVRFLAKYLDFLVLPFAFWAVKMIFFSPHGIYEGYNILKIKLILSKASLHNLKRLIGKLGATFPGVVTEALMSLASLPPLKVLLPFVILPAATLSAFAIRRSWRISSPPLRQYGLWILVGFFLLILAFLPYILVFKIPGNMDWTSRHQLLVPLGGSIILFFMLRALLRLARIPISLSFFVFFFLAFSFVISHIQTYLEYQMDWYKQVSLIENFRKSEPIRDHSTFLFIDSAEGLNARGRIYRFYEYTGLMKKALGDETRFGTSKVSDLTEMDWLKYKKGLAYNIREYTPRPPELIVEIMESKRETNVLELLRDQ